MEGFAQSYQTGRQMGGQEKLGQLTQQYQLGNPQEKQAVLGQIAQYSPQQAQFLQQQQVAQQAQQQKKTERWSKYAVNLNQMIEKASPEQRPALWKAGRKFATDSGADTTGSPEEWNEDAKQYLNTVAGMSGEQEDRKVLKDVSGRQRYKDTGELVFEGVKQTASPEEQAKKEKVLFDKATTLRKEFTANSKAFVQVRDAQNRIKASVAENSPAGDLALIFNYMKVLDPGSVVRESEFATAENAGNIPERVRGTYNKLFTEKGRLSEKQRKDFVDRAEKLYNAQLDSQKRLVNKFGTIAKRAGVDKQDVLLEFANETPEAIEAVKEVEGQQQASPSGQKTTISEGRTMTNQQTGERFVVKGGVWSKV